MSNLFNVHDDTENDWVIVLEVFEVKILKENEK